MYLLICSRSINSYNIFPSSHIFAVSMSMCNCPHLVYVSLSLREKDFDWLISSLHTKAIHNLDVDWLAFWEKCITGWINYVQKSGGRTVINTRLFFQQGNEWDTFPYEELWAQSASWQNGIALPFPASTFFFPFSHLHVHENKALLHLLNSGGYPKALL